MALIKSTYTITMRVTLDNNPLNTKTIIDEIETYEGGTMSSDKKLADLTIELGFTIASVFGEYSNLKLSVGITEKNADVTDGYDDALAKLHMKTAVQVAKLTDRTLVQLGKQPIMVDLIKNNRQAKQ